MSKHAEYLRPLPVLVLALLASAAGAAPAGRACPMGADCAATAPREGAVLGIGISDGDGGGDGAGPVAGV